MALCTVDHLQNVPRTTWCVIKNIRGTYLLDKFEELLIVLDRMDTSNYLLVTVN